MAEFGLSFSGIYFCISSSNFIATIISIDDLILSINSFIVLLINLSGKKFEISSAIFWFD